MDEDKLLKKIDKMLDPIREDLKKVQVDLQEVKDVQQNQVLPSVVHTEAVLESYADSYKMNKKNIERLDDRMAIVEEESGITPPPELAIHR